MANTPPYYVDQQVDKPSIALLDSYDLVRRLIHSGTTVIYEAISTRGRLRGRHLALKKVQPSASIAPSVVLHRALCHPNIVALHSIVDFSSTTPFDYWHVLEFCSEGNLFDMLHSRHPPTFLEAELRQITKGITNALVYLKEERIIHRNIDSTNILLGQGCKPKICDFKHAIHLHSKKGFVLKPLIGTVYPAPELLTIPSQYDFGVDAWSFGCVLYTCTGEPSENIPKLNSEYLFPKCSPEFRCLILSLLNPSADKRLHVELISKHAYLTTDISIFHPDFLGDPQRSSVCTRMSSTSNLRPLRSISTIIPVLNDQQASQETHIPEPRHIRMPSTITRSKKRPPLKSIENIPLPRFLQTQLESRKILSLNTVKPDRCGNSTTNSAPRSTSDKSHPSVTFLEKMSKVEKLIPAAFPSTDKTNRAILPIGTTRPLPIDTSSLPPKTHKLANGTLTILASHSLLVDFRQNQRRHGLKGDQVMLIESKGISIFDAPHLSIPSCLMEPVHRYDLADLPPTYWKQYNDAADFVDQIRRKIPHVTVYESEAKCTLMSNPPPSDIEIILYEEDSSTDKTKARGSKGKLQAPTMRIQYSRQRNHLELAQKLIGDRGTEWKKEFRPCLDSSDISKILLLDDSNQLARKGLTLLLNFLKTCDQLESPVSADTKRTNLTGITPVPSLEFRPATVQSTVLPFVYDNLSCVDESRYLESVGWCIRCHDHNNISGDAKYHILFLDGTSLVVDIGRNDLVFSSLHGEPVRFQISSDAQYPSRVKKYTHFIDNFLSLF